MQVSTDWHSLTLNPRRKFGLVMNFGSCWNRCVGWVTQWRKKKKGKPLSCGGTTFRGWKKTMGKEEPKQCRVIEANGEGESGTRNDSFFFFSLCAFIYIHSVFAHESFIKHLLSVRHCANCWRHSNRHGGEHCAVQGKTRAQGDGGGKKSIESTELCTNGSLVIKAISPSQHQNKNLNQPKAGSGGY